MDRSSIMTALRNADAAGDEEAARRLAAMLSKPELQPAKTAAQSRQEDFDSMPWYQKAAIGYGQSVDKMYTGARGLLGGDTAQAEADQAMVDSVDSGWKTAGNIASDVAMYALPGAAAKGLKTALAADLGGGAVMDYVRQPGEGESRLGNVGVGLAGAGIGHGIASGVGKVAGKGLARSRAGQKMLDEGIPLTPAMAADTTRPLGRAVAWAERRGADVPGVAGRVGTRQTAAQEAWNLKILNDVNPLRRYDEAPPIQNIGQAGIKELNASFGVAYDDVWDKVTPKTVNWKGLQPKWKKTLDSVSKDVPTDLQSEALRRAAKVEDELIRFAETGDTNALQRADDMLREGAGIADGGARPWFTALRKDLQNSLPGDAGRKLRQIDNDYASYAVIQRAASYKAVIENGGVLRPTDLTAAVKAKGAERQLARGDARMQASARRASDTIGGFVPREDTLGQKLTLPAVAAGMAFAPGTTTTALTAGNVMASESARRLLTGQAGPAPHLRQASSIAGRLSGRYMSEHDRKMEELKRQAMMIRNQQ